MGRVQPVGLTEVLWREVAAPPPLAFSERSPSPRLRRREDLYVRSPPQSPHSPQPTSRAGRLRVNRAPCPGALSPVSSPSIARAPRPPLSRPTPDPPPALRPTPPTLPHTPPR